MKKSMSRCGRRGAAAVEFALVAVALFGALLGLVELSRAYMANEVLNHAARAAAREATLPGSTVRDVMDAAESAARVGMVTLNDADVSVSIDTGGGNSFGARLTDTSGDNSTLANAPLGTTVKVTASTTYGRVGWVAALFVKSAAKLSATAVMRHE